jgi:hypothetical protein
MRSSWFVGGLMLSVGLAIVLWSWHLWRKPESLSRSSLLYRYFCLDWQVGPRRKKGSPEQLTNEQIKYYAVRGVGAGVLLIIVAVLVALKA